LQGNKSIIRQGSTDLYVSRGGGGGGQTAHQAPFHTVGDVASFGGSGQDYNIPQSGNNYTSAYGNKGGTAGANGSAGGGGGGGSSQVGQNSILVPGLDSQNGPTLTPFYRGGIGGQGTYFALTNSYFCGGGTGGTNTNKDGSTLTGIAALGGGGAGANMNNQNGIPGTSGTGGGGGGGDWEGAGAKGGSGIVIIR
jgi:hypothetical protein